MKQIRIFNLLPLLAILLSGCGDGTKVRVTQVKRESIVESFSEPAKTRLEKTYRITMPEDGRIGRIDSEPGDRVQAGQVLARFDTVPFEQAVKEAEAAVQEFEAQLVVKDNDELELTALEETLATIEAASEALNAADAQIAAERARAQRADKELKRKQELSESQAIPLSELDDAKLEAETSLINLRKEQFDRAALNAIITAVHLGPEFVREYISKKDLERVAIVEQLTQARARLVRAKHELDLAEVTSPIDGIVLEKYEQGGGPFPVGTPLLLLGNLEQLEVETEVLTQDALQLHPGSTVEYETAMGMKKLSGEVTRIDPAGFTKLSSLGVEQQRVLVISSLDSRPENLGVGYRVQSRFFTGSKDDALVAPRFSVLQAPDRSYYVLKVEGGVLKKQPVEIGLQSDLKMEIVEGLTEQDRIVAVPEAGMEEGQSVEVVEE